ncbi:hypothetical protein B0A69_02960 [Chryseobacterium shigense]|uniref:Uncharacterized protein n=1 Tax=Chryseobacterium shigense TaxID=297244 RepID=A0A1N7I7Y0_9FLAO|nr:hypothetical protein B0A69_02960 [Chryseobacterium shigense]SIS33178.1 hypothetical protein SAMN05421639_102539 [Chryseobacterium shigense]
MYKKYAKMQFLLGVGNVFLQYKEQPYFKNISVRELWMFLKKGCGVFYFFELLKSSRIKKSCSVISVPNNF